MTEVTKEFIPKNEDEKIIEIEIERLCSFKNHPFQVKDASIPLIFLLVAYSSFLSKL